MYKAALPALQDSVLRLRHKARFYDASLFHPPPGLHSESHTSHLSETPMASCFFLRQKTEPNNLAKKEAKSRHPRESKREVAKVTEDVRDSYTKFLGFCNLSRLDSVAWSRRLDRDHVMIPVQSSKDIIRSQSTMVRGRAEIFRFHFVC